MSLIRRRTLRTALVVTQCVVVVLVLVLGCAEVSVRTEPGVWTVDSLSRVAPYDAVGARTTAQISAAGGEYESFQVVVGAGRTDLTGVDLAVSSLLGPDGAVIPTSNVTRYREHYVEVSRSSPDRGGPNRPLPPGEYADALIPFVDPISGEELNGPLRAAGVDVPAGRNQPYWIDVLVPRTVPAGLYTGSYTVSTDQQTTSGRIELTVFGFVLPEQPTLYSSFLNWSGRESVDRELLENRLMPGSATAESARSYGADTGMNAGDLGFYSGADRDSCTMSAPPEAVDVSTAVAEWSTLDILLYNYTADEIAECANLTESIKSWARRLHASNVQQLITMMPRRDLFTDGSGGAGVDIWAVLPVMYDSDPAVVADAIDAGMQVWSYNALVQDDYSPKWLIDFTPINFRIMPGYLNRALGLTGSLYWRVDNWTDDPWRDVHTYMGGYPGDGMLVYPGEEVGLVGGATPSIRLKWLRDGVEDYEYAVSAAQGGQARRAAQIVENVARGWGDWTRDPSVLLQARRDLAVLASRVVGRGISRP